MAPKFLLGPSHAAHPDASNILRGSSRGGADRQVFHRNTGRRLSAIQSPEPATLIETVKRACDYLRQYVDFQVPDMDEWMTSAKELGFPRYAEAFRTTVRNDETAYLQETVTFLADVIETNTNEELKDSDGLDTVLERFEHIRTWYPTREVHDAETR